MNELISGFCIVSIPSTTRFSISSRVHPAHFRASLPSRRTEDSGVPRYRGICRYIHSPSGSAGLWLWPGRRDTLVISFLGAQPKDDIFVGKNPGNLIIQIKGYNLYIAAVQLAHRPDCTKCRAFPGNVKPFDFRDGRGSFFWPPHMRFQSDKMVLIPRW